MRTRWFFREVSEDGLFWESTEQFEWCFVVDWTGASLIKNKEEGKETRRQQKGNTQT
jgi:hypothetical protein